MRGKNLLAVLAMVVPGLLLIVLMAFTLLPSADELTAPPDAESIFARKPNIATQKRMRDPWEKPEYAKTSSARRSEERCDAGVSDQETPCFYW